jgi:hypothetical protein
LFLIKDTHIQYCWLYCCWQALAELHVLEKQYEKALAIYVEVNTKRDLFTIEQLTFCLIWYHIATSNLPGNGILVNL